MQTIKVSEKSFSLFRRLFLSINAFFITLITMAQDGGGGAELDVNVNTDSGGGFFASPWVWVVGIAVFILLLVALLRGGGSRREV